MIFEVMGMEREAKMKLCWKGTGVQDILLITLTMASWLRSYLTPMRACCNIIDVDDVSGGGAKKGDAIIAYSI